MNQYRVEVNDQWGETQTYYEDTRTQAIRTASEECSWEGTVEAIVYDRDGCVLNTYEGDFH